MTKPYLIPKQRNTLAWRWKPSCAGRCMSRKNDKNKSNEMQEDSRIHNKPLYWYVEIKRQLVQQMIFIADLIACSTCFGHHYAHYQELESIIQLAAACRIWCLVFKLSVWCGAEGCVSGLRAVALLFIELNVQQRRHVSALFYGASFRSSMFAK